MEDDAAGEAGEHRERVGVGGARVDHRRLAGLRCDREQLLEEARLRVVRRVVAEPVETGLAHADRLRVREQLAHRGDVRRRSPSRPRAGGCRGRRTRLRARRRARAPAGSRGVRADRDDARHAGVACTRDDVGRRIVERVEVRVRVDHDDMRASSSSTVSGGSLRKSGRGSRSGCPGVQLCSASSEPTQLL